jgi:predicted nuclease with TOPRIM domain
MTADVENLILERLRRIDTIQGDIREIRERLGHIERNQGELALQYASVSTRMDRMDLRIARIEQRLELADA